MNKPLLHVFRAITIIVFAMGFAQTTSAQIGLIAHYTFDEGSGTVAADASGSGHTGVINGADWTTGRLNNALSFGGSNDRVEIGTFDIPGNAMTLSAWINPSSYGSDARIISKADGDQAQDHWWMLSFSGQQLRTRLKTAGTTGTFVAGPGGIPPLNSWTHVTTTYNGAIVKIYMDGVEVLAQGNAGSIDQDNTKQIWIGNNPVNQHGFVGAIDDVRIYSRSLSLTEIQNLANGGDGGTPPQCADGLDNDTDDLIDHPNDPGCSSPEDNNETDPPPPPPGTKTGLDFPSNPEIPQGDTVRFRFDAPHLNGLPIYGPNGNGVTYIWKIKPRRQPGYYTTFFWGNDDGEGNLNTFTWNNGGADTYYGFHPYPDPPPDGTDHKWEISVDANDFREDFVVYDRWFTQAAVVWEAADGRKHHEFYWDLPNTDAAHRVTHTSAAPRNELNPPVPALTWGDAPWAPGNELLSGVLRGVQVYNNRLPLADIMSEIDDPLSTTIGASSIWYMNLDPTPTDISDKSGNDHNPVWVGNRRPALYIETPMIIISDIQANLITQTSATIQWTTDVLATSQVEYGLDTSYGSQTTRMTNPGTAHSQTLNSLDSGTTYHYRVKSADNDGNEIVSADQTFTTAGIPNPLPTVTLTAAPMQINPGESAILSWDSTNASSCTASGDWNGPRNLSGSESVSPDITAFYNLTCTSPAGNAFDALQLTVGGGESICVPIVSSTGTVTVICL